VAIDSLDDMQTPLTRASTLGDVSVLDDDQNAPAAINARLLRWSPQKHQGVPADRLSGTIQA